MYQLMAVALIVLAVHADEDLPSVSMEIMTNEVTTTVSTSTKEEIHFPWLKDAIKDIVYYLRGYKFNEFDRRYHKNGTPDYFATFPKPPLRSLHWEVQQHCDLSFIHCMEYLHKQVKKTDLRRKDDSSIVIVEQNWTKSKNSAQISTINQECKNMLKTASIFAHPFQGPLERFKWRTTASYYLCWYAMNEVPYLEHLGEPCDNFAECLDAKFGAQNKDIRANDTTPFGCILYSLCPDPCCPLRHISSYKDCWNNELNPCFLHNSHEHRNCLVERANNRDFTNIVLNRWNVTCKCNNSGYVWDSKYGLCIDVNECMIGNHTCNDVSEICINLPGSYLCVCNWGFVWSDKFERCIESAAVKIIKGKFRENIQETSFKFSFKALLKKLFKSSASLCYLNIVVYFSIVSLNIFT